MTSSPHGGRHLLLAPGLGIAQPLTDLLGRLARRHAVHAHDRALGPPAAVLLRPGARWRPPRAPVAWWVEHPRDVPAAVPRDVRLVVTWRPALPALDAVAGAGIPIEVLPAPWLDGSEWRPVVPFVRARWRRRLRLPERLVAVLGTPDAPIVDEATANDALFVCSAAVVGPAHVLRALALGAPVVCSSDVAELVGAENGRHAVVADSAADRAAAADAVAGDLVQATGLARRGRQLFEARHDIAAAARRVATALDLPPIGIGPVAGLASRLEELGTPIDAGVAARVAGAVGTLGPSGVDVATRSLRW